MNTAQALSQLIGDLRSTVGQRAATEMAASIDRYAEARLANATLSPNQLLTIQDEITHAREIHEEISHGTGPVTHDFSPEQQRQISSLPQDVVNCHADDFHANDDELSPGHIEEDAHNLLHLHNDFLKLLIAAHDQTKNHRPEIVPIITTICEDQISSAIAAHVNIHHTPPPGSEALTVAQRAAVLEIVNSGIRNHCEASNYPKADE